MSNFDKSLTHDVSPLGHNIEAKQGSNNLRVKRPSVELFRVTGPGSADPEARFLEGYTVKVDVLEVEYAWTDLLQSLIVQSKNNPSANMVENFAEGTLDFTTGADLGDYAVMNVQLPHSWELGTDLKPHVHWFQVQDNVPNWLIQYRWQKNGGAKTTSWSNLPMNSEAFTYTAGTILQISGGATISPPTGAGLSDIVQFRLLRDNANTSTLFAGADPYTVTAAAVNFDVHYSLDTLGSQEEYVK